MSGLRQRHTAPQEVPEESPAEKYLKPLRKLDVFPKQTEDVAIKTQTGGVLTAGVSIIIFILFIGELLLYMQEDRKEIMGVDVQTSRPMPIHVDITFHDVDCDLLECHEIDNAEQREHGIEHMVSRVRIDTATGRELNPWARTGYCGPCTPSDVAGASWARLKLFSKHACCNTCSDVRRVYKSKGLDESKMHEIMPQCAAERLAARVSAERRQQGCRVQGILPVPKLAGNFHFGLYNTSHTINSIYIGDYHSAIHNPLTDRTEIVSDGSNVFFRYFLKIVPTTIVDKGGREFPTYQYSATHARQVERFRRARKNGVFFVYDLSPFNVRYETNSRSFLHFLTNLCAIVGGVFTVAGLTDKLIYKSFAKYFGTSPTLGID